MYFLIYLLRSSSLFEFRKVIHNNKFPVPPNILPFTFDKPANVGEYLQAACTINFGDLPLTITWTFNGLPISQRNNNYVINNSKRSSLLIIESVDAKHAGSYTCVGENRAGRSTYSADLIVYGQSIPISS